MSTGQFTVSGISICLRGAGVAPSTAARRPDGPDHQGVALLALVPSPGHGGRTCPALFGAARCAKPTEEGEGNHDGYCTRHLDLMAGDQEDWESDEEYARRRRQLCPHSLGARYQWQEWCPEPSDPESEGGFCLVHEPTYNPEAPEYDAEAAHRFLDETVPCLQCRGIPGCDMCGGTGRITLARANWHRGDDTLPPPDKAVTREEATVATAQSTDNTEPDPTSHARALLERGLTLEPCYGCGVQPGQEHQDGCDHARCPDCGEQLIFHDCEAWDPDADGPDRAALWHGMDQRKEVAQILNWWTTHAGIDHLVEDYTRVLFADALHQITWDPRGQTYLIGQIDNAALDRAIARSH